MEIANGIRPLMLPPIDPTQLPPDVRGRRPEAQQAVRRRSPVRGHARPADHRSRCSSAQTTAPATTARTARQLRDGSSSLVQLDHGRRLPVDCCRRPLADAHHPGGGLGLADELYRSMALRFGIGTRLGTGATVTAARPALPRRRECERMIELIEHLERQLESSRRLLEIVLAQRDAIREQDVEGVLARLADVQAEMVTRAQLEQRARRAAAPTRRRALGVPADDARRWTTCSCCVPDAEAAARARTLSAELQGPARRDRARARPEPRADPPGARVPRPPDARALGHAAGRLLGRPGGTAPRPDRQPRRHEGLSRCRISTFIGLETALRGILAQQRALDVTGHNIANANTVGYTPPDAPIADRRVQRARLPASPPAGQLGTGVDVAALPAHPRRVRRHPAPRADDAAGQRPGDAGRPRPGRAAPQRAVRHGPQLAARRVLVGAGRTSSNAPENMATRQALVAAPAQLADGFNQSLDPAARRSQSQTGAERRPTRSTRSTRSATQIAQLNDAIANATAAGDTPNDLLDQRDVLIDKLVAARQRHRRPTRRRRGRRHVRRRHARHRRARRGRRSAETDMTEPHLRQARAA